MKKLLLAASIILTGTIATTFSSHSLTAEAKVHSLNNTIAKNIKKGTFPHANGKIGTVRKNLKLKKQGNTFYSRSIPKTALWEDEYLFNTSKVTSKSKVTLVSRTYGYLISGNTIEKKVGKELRSYSPTNSVDYARTSFYKAGKYYLGVYNFTSSSDTYTWMAVGTKKAIMKYYDVVFY